ncbi:MAG TPA: protein kinase [Pyrinomonadaceae bacterium]|nr:protein kinase [Pyrinomonadaceae bacterium]
MPDSNWENLKDLFHAALALPPAERPAYIDHACNGDAVLGEALESLLEAHAETNNFVDTPAYQAAAQMLVGEADFTTNQTVAHYRIVSLLGEGGMGRVYLAEDTKLHRRVALKFLSRSFTEDQDRLRRFEQEARAASALNHPNILTIHEISEFEGHRFIATEFIEGETLRERLHTELSIDNAVEISIQIASALVAAHRVGVVHRDIKPENIMIRREDGLVKVLDFGLAKMSRTSSIERAKSTETHVPAHLKTGPGVVIGTVAYMSPEQARGESVDAQTDIWSLGVVLYEMIAGTSPFIAATSNEIISAILAKIPSPPLSRYSHDLPANLEETVAKALTKNKAGRYHTSQDLLNDLRHLKQSLQIGASVDHSVVSYAVPTTQHSSSAEYIVNQIKVHKRSAIALAALILLGVVSGIAFYEWRVRRAVAATAPKIQSLAVLPLKSLDSSQNFLGIGIADAVIRRISQTGQLTVRPTSAVLKYVKEDTDSLTVARQLSTDAILEGTVQSVGDRLRVSVNLLRVRDGFSLWAENFDMSANDLFAIQDKVGNEVAQRLELPLDSSQQARSLGKYPTNPVAYEAYIKGVFSLDQRQYGPEAMPQMQTTIDYFNKAIEVDPDYALAHAELAFAYVWTATFVEPENPKWANLAREEIDRSQALGPQLPETHYARGLLLWTAYGGYQNEEAIRELLIAKRLDPHSARPDLAPIYQHCGLDDLAAAELKRALEIDPTSQSLKDLTRIIPFLQGKPDEWLIAHQKLKPNASPDIWYLMRKGRLDEADKAMREALSKPPNPPIAWIRQALLRSLRGDFSKAIRGLSGYIAAIPLNDQARHHATYDVACVYALAGKSQEAVKWLKETANTGFPNYPLFERDPFLNRIRQAPEFIQFMSDQKAQWEKLRAEFGS